MSSEREKVWPEHRDSIDARIQRQSGAELRPVSSVIRGDQDLAFNASVEILPARQQSTVRLYGLGIAVDDSLTEWFPGRSVIGRSDEPALAVGEHILTAGGQSITACGARPGQPRVDGRPARAA